MKNQTKTEAAKPCSHMDAYLPSHARNCAEQNTPNAKHTPGPWNTDSGPFIQAEDGLIVCRLGDGQHDEGSEVGANARLIAAAPDLLEAAKGVLNAFKVPADSTSEHWVALRAAIAKAEGR